MRRLSLIILTLMYSRTILAAGTLSQWAASFSTPQTQHEILQKIYPDDLGALSAAVSDSQEGTLFFPAGNRWVQLARRMVWMPAPLPDEQSVFLVVAQLRQSPKDAPISAITYQFRDTTSPPTAVTSGYANRERVYQTTARRLGRSFILVQSLLMNRQGTVSHQTATVFQVLPVQSGNSLRQVWISPSNIPYFHLGFAPLHETGGEDLILKTDHAPVPKGQFVSGQLWDSTSADAPPVFHAYQWVDGHFESDEGILDSPFQSLPANTWVF